MNCVNQNIGCNLEINYYDYEDHLNKNCEKAKKMCAGCLEVKHNDQIMMHVRECDEIFVECSQCQESKKRKNMEHHLKFKCRETIVECKACGVEKFRRNLRYHKLKCPEVKIKCGSCGIKVERKSKGAHLNSLLCRMKTKRRLWYLENQMEVYKNIVYKCKQYLTNEDDVNSQENSLASNTYDNYDSFYSEEEDEDGDNDEIEGQVERDESDIRFEINNVFNSYREFEHNMNMNISINNVNRKRYRDVTQFLTEIELDSESISNQDSCYMKNKFESQEKKLDEIIAVLEDGVEDNLEKLDRLIPIKEHKRIRNWMRKSNKKSELKERIIFPLWNNEICTLILFYYPKVKEFGIKLEKN